MSVFRYRGVKTVLDTTTEAEWDIKGYDLSDNLVASIGLALSRIAFSPLDRTVGPVRVREIDGIDVIYTVGRDAGQCVITIAGFRRPDPQKSTEMLLTRIGDTPTLGAHVVH